MEIISKDSDYLIDQVTNFNMTKSLIYQEMSGLYGNSLLKDLNHIIQMYAIYENGANFNVETTGDYVPAVMKYKVIKGLIDKEARFLFSVPPDFNVRSTEEDNEKKVAGIQEFVNLVLQKNKVSAKLVKAAKDCFIGKRIAIATNFNDTGITVSFIPSLEFIFETDPNNVDKLTKFIQFYSTTVNDIKDQQRVYKKKWWLDEKGNAWFNEGIYNGSGALIEELVADNKTLLTWIPVEIITNDGLSGDPFGVSEIESLEDNESWYSKLSSKDMDSIRKGADQITYTIDMSSESTKGLSRGAGAFWDLSTEVTAEGKTGSVGVVENTMGYSPALDVTLKRIKTHMHDMLDVPDTSSEALQGIVTSGKTLKAIYWGLIVRCNEKMLVWRPALVETMRSIIEGAKLYPESRKPYTTDSLAAEYDLEVENSYPLPEDEAEEKDTDLAEVSGNTMSKRDYMKKWRGLTDSQVDDELKQMALERELLEDAFMLETK